jgi:hypothetical protein
MMRRTHLAQLVIAAAMAGSMHAPAAAALAQAGEPSPCRTPVAYPDSLDITPAAADLPPQIAAFVGVWETAAFGDGSSERIVIERVSPTGATWVRAWSAGPGFQAGWARDSSLVVLEDGRIRGPAFRDGHIFLTMNPDLNSIQREAPSVFRPGTTFQLTLTRCAWQ